MTTPLRVDCATTADVPHVDRLRAWATWDQHVVLQFPADALGGPDGAEKTSLVRQLADALPDHRVFDSGGDADREHITVTRVIRADEVRANADAFLHALRLYRRTATDLARRLADRLGVAPDRLMEDGRGRGRDRPGWADRVRALVRLGPRASWLDREWRYAFHGTECHFASRRTGQEVEVRLDFGSEFGALDPYFFALFAKTTPGLEAVARLMPDSFHDATRVLEVLARDGHLRVVDGPHWVGQVVRDEEDGPDAVRPATPDEWSACADPLLMMPMLVGRVSARKWRLFLCACCRRVWRLLPDPRHQRAVEVAERHADGQVTQAELADAREECLRGADDWRANAAGRNPDELAMVLRAIRAATTALGDDPANRAMYAVREAARAEGVELMLKQNTEQPGGDEFRWLMARLLAPYCHPLRCVMGNPIQPAGFDPAWRTATVVALAERAYDTRDFSVMPILADALMDAGCPEGEIIDHCRQGGDHWAGCWVVDLVLGRS